MKHKDLEREELGNIAQIAQQIHDAAMERNLYEVRSRFYYLQQAIRRLEVLKDLVYKERHG